uniref:hypothetical protein n=1 Tax=Neorhizobium sp. EC2-8 TaxID=3129230 RepID=UPI0031014CC5
MQKGSDAGVRSSPGGKLEDCIRRHLLGRSHVAAGSVVAGCARPVKPLQKAAEDGFRRRLESVHCLNAMPHLGISVMKLK